MPDSLYEPIENYGIIGNLHTAALVSLKGSIDFLCYPRFDSPTVFASLLDAEKGGCFNIRPLLNGTSYKQLYLPESAILLTRFLAAEGIAELTDFMPVIDGERKFVIARKITTVRGTIHYKMSCKPRFNYARTAHHVKKGNNMMVFEAVEGDTSLLLHSNVPMQVSEEDVQASFTLEEGQSACFILNDDTEKMISADGIEDIFMDAFHACNKFWKRWTTQSTYTGRWREIVHRSAITLKLLSSKQYGTVIAAATFGLPEALGGRRNWDYRYTWIRDAAFTMYAFLRLGFMEEAKAFITWIRERSREGVQLMYTVDGQKEIEEKELPHFSGYKNSKPVRIGNAAYKQLQLDIYGELIDTIYLYNKDGGPITYEFWMEMQQLIDFVCNNWQQPDHGIWEVRGEKRHFLHSRMMCWVAIDRAMKIGRHRSFPYPEEDWRKVRDEIFKNIFNNFWNEEKQSFVQHESSVQLDGSILLMPLMRILSPFEERMQKTMNAIERELRTDVLIYRYHNTEDGFESEEGTFTMCSFWHVECLAKCGHIERASESFEKILGYANHLGLFSEQISRQGEHLGNFPQAFTHLALISAALQLDESIRAGGSV